MEELKEIGKRRRKLGITQVNLAKESGVSQSLIAKLERGTIDIAYSKAVQIFRTLERLEKKEELKMEDIMTSSVLSLNKKDMVRKAVDMMRKKEISQIPIFDGSICIGSISEEDVVDLIQNGTSSKTIESMPVTEIMESPFPIIAKESSIKEVTALLQRNKAVLISERGRIIGIVSKADFLKTLSTA